MPNTSKADFELGTLGYRGKVGFRGAGGNGLRSARGNTENVNPNGGMASKMSPRLGPSAGANNGRSLFPLASSRRNQGTSFGTDITNITAKADNKLKPLKQQSSPSRNAPLPSSPSAAQISVTEQQLAKKTEEINVQDAEEYVNDINNQLFKDETTFLPRSDYMEKQEDLTPKMRMILMDWLIEVHMKYKLRSETLHLAVNLIDRFLTRTPVARKKLQLVGVVAMFIASKFEEIHPPELHDWVYITDKAYTKEDVLRMECTMLTTLSFQIVVPTVAHFFQGLQKANDCNGVHCHLAQYIIELCILDIKMLEYTPSQTVSAALLLSNQLLGRSPVWPQTMVQRSRHSEEKLRGCVDTLRQLFETDRAGGDPRLQAVHKKFSTKEHHSVATMRL